MNPKKIALFASCFSVLSLVSCKNKDNTTDNTTSGSDIKKDVPALVEETVSYSADTVQMKGFVVYDSSVKGPRPAVLVVHEWWGLTDYPKMRARQLAGLGYIAMAVDMYGNGLTADNPDLAGKLATPFYKNPMMARARFDAALNKIKTYAQTDTSRIAAIGYCFGGGMVLNVARLGDNLKAVVSFHGNLVGVPPKKELLKAKILACHGAADQFVKPSEVEEFKKQMDSIHADYVLKIYPDAMHAFTNPQATELGKKFNIPIAYNAAADSASWRDMRMFFDKVLK
jgi:dienelactone hydrolase